MKRHEVTSLDTCVDGMKLAESVIDSSGMMMVAEGTILTDKLISRLLAKNITAVCIEVVEQCSEEEIQQRRQQVDEQVKKRFRNVMGNMLMQQLCDALIDYRSKDA